MSCLLWAAAFIYFIKTSEWQERDAIVMRATIVSPGLTMIFVGLGRLCVGYPE